MSFRKFILQSLNPVKNLENFQNYLYYSKQIVIYHNKKVVNSFRLAIFLILYQTFHQIYLFQNPSKSILDKFIHEDVAFMLLPKPAFNLLTSLSGFQVAYNLSIFYFHYNKQVNTLFDNIIIKNDPSFFISPYYKSENICATIRNFYLIQAKLLYNLVAVLGMSFLVGIFKGQYDN